MENQETDFPIIHWSKSSLMLFLSNKLAFKKRYILKLYDSKTSPSALVGLMGHKALEEYFNGTSEAIAIERGLLYMNTYLDDEINWGKTGTREKVRTNYAQAIKYYFEEMPDYRKDFEILHAELNHTAYINLPNGERMSIPAKAHVDLTVRNKKKQIEIHDAKFVSSYTLQDERNWAYILQAMFNYFVVLDYYKEAPVRMVFKECKVTKNTNGDQQVQDYEIVFAEHPEYFDIFYRLYNDCTKELMRKDVLFLPNPQDMWDGEDSMNNYAQELLSIDLSDIEIRHKTEIKEIRQVQYRPSAHDEVENTFLSEEEKIKNKFAEFGIPIKMQETIVSPHVTLYTAKPSRGVRMSTIQKHVADIKIALKAAHVRIEAPMPGTDTIGVEIGNKDRTFVSYSSLRLDLGELMVPLGIDSKNETVLKDIREMPHILVAGATGSGKSVFLNTLIKSLTDQMPASQLGLILIDMKRVELIEHSDLPHLESPVITDLEPATKALKWLVDEMERRFDILKVARAKNIGEYTGGNMKYLVVIIDEFADLILGDYGVFVEPMIIRLAQKARAVGIHLVIATQRPSVNVVTGLIKANISTRICFRTASQIDSKVVLDQGGAEELTGKGDCLFLDPSKVGLQRLQAFSNE